MTQTRRKNMQEKKYVQQSTNEITLQDIINIMRKRFILLISVFAIVVLGTFIYLKFFATPLYEATAKIKIPTSSGGIGSLSNAAALILGTGGTGSPDITTQQEIILSRPVLEEVIRKTNLLEIRKNEIKKNKDKLTIDDIIDSLKDEKVLSITSVKNSPIMEVKITDKNKQLALKLLKELINVYTNFYVALNKDEKMTQLEMIEKQIPNLEKEIAELGEKIKEFRLTKSFSPSEEGNIYFSKLISLTNDKNSLENEYKILNTTITNLRTEVTKLKGDLQRKVYTPRSALLDSYISKLSDLQVQYNITLVKYTENHPNTIMLKKQIEETQKQIDDEIKRIANSQVESPNPLLQSLYSQLTEAEMKLPILKARLELINRGITDIENKIKTLPEIEQEYIKLQRDYALKQNIYSALAQKYEELRINAASTEINKPQIVDPPYVPEKPSKPNKKLTLAIGGVLGLFLGIMGAFLREATDNKIRTIDEIQKLAQVPIIVHAKEDQKQAVKTILSHIFANYPEHKKIAISSPDSKSSIEIICKFSAEILTNSSIKFDVIDTTKNESLFIAQNLETEINDKLNKYDYLLIKTKEFKNNYDTFITCKKSDGVILTVKLNSSEKMELLKALSVLEQNNIELYGIIVF